MNKNVMIGVTVAILLLLGIGGYVMMGKKTGQEPIVAEQNSPTPGKQSGSLRQLLSGGVAQKCTYSSGETQGTVYVGGGKMRGDMVTTTDATTTVSHVIVDGTTSYIWMDGQTTGYKMSWDTTTPAPTGNAGQTGFDPDSNVDYDCGVWVSDASMMAMPAGVTFAEMGKLVIPTGMSGPASQCDACASLTGTAKTQCMTALGCSQ